jgi:hypothetical protein
VNDSRGPGIGETVRDTGSDRIGVVMDHQGSYVQLRPLSGGREWDADPSRIEPISQSELLSTRVAEANARSRKSS